MRSNSNAWHSSWVSRMGDNRAYSDRDRSDALETALPARYRSPGRSDLPHLQLELMRGSFARIDTCAKPGEEENNKVRRRELLSFFHGSASLSGTGGKARLRAIARSRPPPRNRGRSGFDSVSSRLTPCCFAPLPLRDGGDFAGTRSMRRGAADGISCGRIDGQIVVGPLRAERIIARRVGLRGRLPPAMLAHDHTPINIGVQQRPCSHRASWCLDAYPVSGRDAAPGRGRRM
jgi:hypothetical protein